MPAAADVSEATTNDDFVRVAFWPSTGSVAEGLSAELRPFHWVEMYDDGDIDEIERVPRAQIALVVASSADARPFALEIVRRARATDALVVAVVTEGEHHGVARTAGGKGAEFHYQPGSDDSAEDVTRVMTTWADAASRADTRLAMGRSSPFEGVVRDLEQAADAVVLVPWENDLSFYSNIISDLVTEHFMRTALFPVTAKDLRAALWSSGVTVLGAGIMQGEDRAVEAARLALFNTIVHPAGLTLARRAFCVIYAAPTDDVSQLLEVARVVSEALPCADIRYRVHTDDDLDDRFAVALWVTDFRDALAA